jgi:hypothetical protein
MYIFESAYAKLFGQYIEFKRNLGYRFADAEYNYAALDRLMLRRNEKATGITKELADAWAVRHPNECDSTHYRRIMYLIQFSAYLYELGYPSYILNLSHKPHRL